MVALVIAELPDHELEFFNRGRRRSGPWPTTRPRPWCCCGRSRSSRSPSGPGPVGGCPRRPPTSIPKPRTGMVFRSLDLGLTDLGGRSPARGGGPTVDAPPGQGGTVRPTDGPGQDEPERGRQVAPRRLTVTVARRRGSRPAVAGRRPRVPGRRRPAGHRAVPRSATTDPDHRPRSHVDHDHHDAVRRPPCRSPPPRRRLDASRSPPSRPGAGSPRCRACRTPSASPPEGGTTGPGRPTPPGPG